MSFLPGVDPVYGCTEHANRRLTLDELCCLEKLCCQSLDYQLQICGFERRLRYDLKEMPASASVCCRMENRTKRKVCVMSSPKPPSPRFAQMPMILSLPSCNSAVAQDLDGPHIYELRVQSLNPIHVAQEIPPGDPGATALPHRTRMGAGRLQV